MRKLILFLLAPLFVAAQSLDIGGNLAGDVLSCSSPLNCNGNVISINPFYLPLAGGEITGNLTVDGAFEAGSYLYPNGSTFIDNNSVVYYNDGATQLIDQYGFLRAPNGFFSAFINSDGGTFTSDSSGDVTASSFSASSTDPGAYSLILYYGGIQMDYSPDQAVYGPNYVLNENPGYVALLANNEVDVGNCGSYSDPSPSLGYDVKAGGACGGGISANGTFNTNATYNVNNNVAIDNSGNFAGTGALIASGGVNTSGAITTRNNISATGSGNISTTNGNISVSGTGTISSVNAINSTNGYQVGGSNVITNTQRGIFVGIQNTATQTSINCSTSGTVTFSEVELGSSYKKIVIYAAACLGTATYGYSVNFSHTPACINTGGLSCSLLTSISTSSITFTGTTTTGFEFIEGY